MMLACSSPQAHCGSRGPTTGGLCERRRARRGAGYRPAFAKCPRLGATAARSSPFGHQNKMIARACVENAMALIPTLVADILKSKTRRGLPHPVDYPKVDVTSYVQGADNFHKVMAIK